MKMNRNTIKFCLAAALGMVAAACAKTHQNGPNEQSKKYFDAWISQNHPDARKTPLGAYILEETDGKGAPVADSCYARLVYSVFSLDGTVTSAGTVELARQVGTYSPSSYIGPEILYIADDNITAGMDEAIKSMKIGGSKKVVIPGWLSTFERYDTAEEYVEKVENPGTTSIYEVRIMDAFNDVVKWENDSLARYVKRFGLAPGDTTETHRPNRFGSFYRQVKAPDTDKAFENGEDFHINYVGRLLNGTVFDTNIADTAKVHGIYSASGSYKPVSISYNEDYGSITMDSNTIIPGFAWALYNMKNHEKGIVSFYSGWGYGYNGSGTKIPGYCPLEFEIEIVDYD